MKKIKIILSLLIAINASSIYADDCNYGEIKLNIIEDTLYSVILENNEVCFPKYVFNFTTVKRLDISNCLYTNIPSEIHLMKGLTELNIWKCYDLDYNDLLSKLKDNNIRTLSLKRDSLKEIPVKLTELKNIEELNLDDNQIETVNNDLFELKQLQSIDLKGNNVTKFDLTDEINYSIKAIDLSYNELKKIPIGLDKFRALRHLNLSYNPDLKIEEICELIENYNSLEHLIILGIKSNGIPNNIKNLKKVKLITTLNTFSKSQLIKLREMGIKIR